MPKVHFIHIFEGQNSGEMLCSPYDYFASDFCERYECLCHDIRTLNLKKIAPDDWVILGGGGLFDVREDFQKTINAVLNRTYKVISWACGHNAHNGRTVNEKIKYESIFLFDGAGFWNFWRRISSVCFVHESVAGHFASC